MKPHKLSIGFLLISDNWSGAENALRNIVIAISKKGKDSYIYCNKEMYNHYLGIRRVKVYNLGIANMKSFFRYLNYLLMHFKLKKILLRDKNDLLFLFLESSFFVGGNLEKLFNVPPLANLRGTEINNFINSKNRLKALFLKQSLENSPRIVSVSMSQIKDLPEKYKKKTVVIPNGVDSKAFKPIRSIKQKKNVVLFVGRIIKDKGINEILSVAKQLPQYEFWFAGQGPLENLINLPNTKLFGKKDREELVKLYNQATICILPSYHEGFSNVGLETLSCGRAFICTPDFAEYIENEKDGIIIPAKDENALKKAIVDLMTNEKKRKMLEKNARAKALKYSWDKVADMYLELSKEVLENENN